MEKITGQRGVERRAMAFTAYGYTLEWANAWLGFNGEWKDTFLHGYALGNGHRTYSPVLMRFHGPDAFSPFGKGGVNAYAYCLADPVNRLDPSGNVSVLWQRALKAVRVWKTRKVIEHFESRRSIERLPDEMIEQIVNYLPLRETHAFARTSKRMYEQMWQGAPQLNLKMQGLLRVQSSELHQLIEVKKIASGVGQVPARALLGTQYNQQKLDRALTNPNRSAAYTEAASIRANRDAQTFRMQWNLGLINVGVE